MQDELREQSLRDEVTGLWNRHYVDEMLDERLASAHVSGEPVCLIVADIDDFEQITAQHGTEAAEDVLRGFAEFLQRQFRPSDVFCRYGDDEFIVGLLSCPHSVGLGRALQLRSLAVTITTRAGVDVPVTASYGSASLPRNGQCSAEVLEAAHAARRGTD
jgi:diguanylate cyclase (GGDEF)-like protein